MFARPRVKKGLGVPPPKRRKTAPAIEEINFDFGAREEYLTGFHKRKVQRAKRAQEEAAKKAREEKLETRKQLREERKQQLEEHIEAINEILKPHRSDDETSDNDEDGWKGIGEDAPAPAPVDHEDEYVDEDRYTLVTVEEVDVDKHGLHKTIDDEDEDEDSEEKKDSTIAKEASEDPKRKTWPKKKKKKKFRYESKEERKLTRVKQKTARKAKADKRRGKE